MAERANGHPQKNNNELLQLCLRVTLVVATLPLVAIAVDSPKLTVKITRLKVKVKGVSIYEALGINNAGAIVGDEVEQPNSIEHGFSLIAGKFTRIDPPDFQLVQVNGINSKNEIVGTFMDLQDRIHGFLYRHKAYTNIGPPGTVGAWGINKQGWIVGAYFDGATNHGWVWNGKKYTTLDVPGATSTIATAINDHGEILLGYTPVGSAFSQAATFDGKKYTKLKVPGTTGAWPGGINNSGDITVVWGPFGGELGGLFHSGKFFMFDVRNSAITDPVGINDHHQMVGRYMLEKDGAPYIGFIATY